MSTYACSDLSEPPSEDPRIDSNPSLDITDQITYLRDRRFPVKQGGQADIYEAVLGSLPVAVKVVRHVEVKVDKKRSLVEVSMVHPIAYYFAQQYPLENQK